MFTLAGPAHCEVEIKRSRFIAHAGRVDTPDDTLAFYGSVADPNATHNCWAWKLAHQHRFNDDGEPAGTAGRPILAAIEGKGLDQVMIVVTRYFGGTKLGAGGLARAYSGAAARCIDQGLIVEVQPELECSIQADFRWTGQVYAALESIQATRLGENFAGSGITIRARISAACFDDLQLVLRDATRGEVTVRRLRDL
jgi:uncharacterized YigZ family protein